MREYIITDDNGNYIDKLSYTEMLVIAGAIKTALQCFKEEAAAQGDTPPAVKKLITDYENCKGKADILAYNLGKLNNLEVELPNPH